MSKHQPDKGGRKGQPDNASASLAEMYSGFRAADEDRPPGAITPHQPTGKIGNAAADEYDLADHRNRAERDVLKTETVSEAAKTVKRWLAAHTDSGETVKSSSTALRVLSHPTAGSLIGTSIDQLSSTPLEDMRRKAGVDQERREIYDALIEKIDLKEGLRMLDRWTRVNIRRYCRSMQQAQKLFPSLTATEIALFPLLKKVPETFLLRDTGFDARAVREKDARHSDEQLTSEMLRAVPQQYEMRVDGIAYGDDRTSIIQIDENASILNPTDKEIVEYQDDAAKDIARLVPLTLEGPRLFQMVQHQTGDALVVGVGLIKREALRLVQIRAAGDPQLAESTALAANESTQPYSQLFLRDAIEELNSSDQTFYQSVEQSAASALIQNTLSYSDGRAVPFRELVQILGLTNSIPSVLLSPEPFTGELHFYGDRILLANSQGEIVDESRLSPYCTSLIRCGLRAETEESSSTNPTMLTIEQNLIIGVHTKLFSGIVRGEASFEEKSSCLSFLEATALDVYQRHGVTLQVLGDRSITELTEAPGGFVTTSLVATGSVKFGLQECAQVANTLDILGPELLANVSTIQKTQSPEIEEDALKFDQTAMVEYDRDMQVITLREAVDLPYSQLTSDAKHERSFLIAMGCGLSLWDNSISNSQKSRWKMLYRAPRQSSAQELEKVFRGASTHAELLALAAETLKPGASGPDLGNCLSIHGMSDAKLKFASSFALFVLANDDFAAAAEHNRVVRDMYHSLETIIEERIGTPPNYSRLSRPLSKAAGGLVAQFPDLLSKDSPDSLLSGIATLLTEALREDSSEENPAQSQEGTDSPKRRKRDDTWEVLNTISTSLFPSMASSSRGVSFVNSLNTIIAGEAVDDVFVEVLTLVERYPETENDTHEPVNDLWHALIENSLVDERW